MDEPTRNAADRLIDEIHETALDPARVSRLIALWEPVMAPIRRAVHRGDASALPRLERHAARALRVLHAVGQRAEPDELARIGHNAAFTIGPDLGIAAVNAAAARLLDLQPGMTLGALDLNAPDLARLEAGAREMISDDAPPPVLLRATRLGASWLMGLRAQAARSGHLLVVTSTFDRPPALAALLRAGFDLTTAESDILMALSEGCAPSRIAAARGRSVETVRAQIKSIMAKTDTASQADLVRLVLSSFDMLPDAVPADRIVHRPNWDHRVQLSDGRMAHCRFLGDPAGRPCLFLPHPLSPAQWSEEAGAEAGQRGIKLIVPHLPGFGGAPLAAQADPLRQSVLDIAGLLADLGHGPLPVLATGDECLRAMALNLARPGLIAAIVACAGVLPLSHADQFDGLGPWPRACLGTARYAPRMLPFLLHAAAAALRGVSGEEMLNRIFAESPADLDILSQMPEDDRRALYDMPVNLLVYDLTRRARTDWQPAIAATRGIPFHLSVGEQDPRSSPEILRAHRSAYPWIDIRTHEAMGMLGPMKEWNTAFDQLNLYE